jgi:hypothetical protein
MASRSRAGIAVAITACTLCAAPAYAYLDPGTGSIILQSVLASIAVAIGVLRLYWYRLKAFFTGANAKADTQDSQESETKNES